MDHGSVNVGGVDESEVSAWTGDVSESEHFMSFTSTTRALVDELYVRSNPTVPTSVYQQLCRASLLPFPPVSCL